MDELTAFWRDTARELGLQGKTLADIKSHANDAQSSASNISPRSYHFLRVIRPMPTDPDLTALTEHLKKLGLVSKHHIPALERLFQVTGQSGPLRMPPELKTPEIKGPVKQDSFSSVMDQISNPPKADRALEHFFRLVDWLADPHGAPSTQPPATVLGAFSRTWNLFTELNPEACHQRMPPSVAVDLKPPVRKLDLKRADIVRPPTPIHEEGTDDTSDDGLWVFSDRFHGLRLDESPLARRGSCGGIQEPVEAGAGTSKSSDTAKDQNSEEDGPKRTYTESVVADLLASFIDAIVSTLLNGPYTGIASTTDQIRFTLGGRDSDPPAFKLTACIDGYTRISDSQGCPFITIFETKARPRPIFRYDKIDQVRRQEAAEIAALEFVYGHRNEESSSKRFVCLPIGASAC